MPKIIKKPFQVSFLLLYGIFIGPTFFAVPAFSFDSKGDPVDSIETVISSIVDPFISKMPVKAAPPKPAPVVREPEKVNDDSSVRTPSEREPDVYVAPKKEPVRVLPSMTLAGVIYNTTRPQAIINGKIYDIGGKIEEAKIVSIQKGEVKVLFYNKQYSLRVGQDTKENANR